jgi:hypothetical protein
MTIIPAAAARMAIPISSAAAIVASRFSRRSTNNVATNSRPTHTSAVTPVWSARTVPKPISATSRLKALSAYMPMPIATPPGRPKRFSTSWPK